MLFNCFSKLPNEFIFESTEKCDFGMKNAMEVCKINRMMVLIIKVPWMLARLEADSNFK